MLLIPFTNGIGQKGELILKSKFNGKERIVYQGNYLEITYNNGEYFMGELKIINNDHIKLVGNYFNREGFSFNNDTLPLKGISEIKITSPFTNIMGAVLTCGGGLFVFGCVAGISTRNQAQNERWNRRDRDFIFLLATEGIVITIVGVILLKARRHYKCTNWDYEIIN